MKKSIESLRDHAVDVHDLEGHGHRADEKPYQHAIDESQHTADEPLPNSGGVLERVLTTRSLPDPGPPPDGGAQAWLQVFCGFLVVFATWGGANSFGAYQTYYTLNLGEPATTISWIGTVQTFLTFFIGAFSGRLLDAGFFIPTFLVGAVLQLIGLFLVGISTKFWQLIITQGVLTGLGGGIFFSPCMGLVSTYFSKRRALALGMVSSGNSIGGMIYPLIVRQLLPKVGFAWTTRVVAFLNLAILSTVICFLRPRLPPRKSGPIIDWGAFRDPTYAWLTVGLFCVQWSTYYTFYYIASFGVQSIGMPYAAALNLVIVVNGAGFPARIIPPFFADRYGQFNVMFPILIVLSIVAFSWLAVTTTSGLYVFTVFYGIWAGAVQSLLPSTVAYITPQANMVGTRLGMVFSTISFAALTGPPIGGALQSATGGKFVGATIFSALAATFAMVFVFAARWSKAGGKIKAFV